MKVKLITYTLSILSALTLVSCDDFLAKDPDPRAQLDSPTTVSQLLVSAYPDITYYQFLETMSDNVGDVKVWYQTAVNPYIEKAYWWENINGYTQDSPTGYWNSAYEAISVTNHALEAIEKVSNPQRYLGQKAEALVCRAYSHFMLVNIFSKTYNKETASTDLGIPYVQKAEKVVFEKYTRGTVEAVYDSIESDLQKGMANIALNNYSVEKYHFNLEATYAFAARFYLFKNEPDSVIKYATLCLGNQPSVKIRDMNGPKYLNQAFNIFEATFTDSKEPCNLLMASTASAYTRSVFARYKLTPQIKQEIYETNITGGSLVYPFTYYTIGDRTIHTPKFKEWFKRESVNANYGVAYIMSILFSADEVLLNRAEAYAMLNTAEGTAAAYADLNIFYSKRIESYSSSSHNITKAKIDTYAATLPDNLDPYRIIPAEQMNLMKVIVDTRRKEFIMEALRWFDVKRFNIEITHSSFDGSKAITLHKNSPLREIQIPPQAISSGIEANPR